jgi:signal peptidase
MTRLPNGVNRIAKILGAILFLLVAVSVVVAAVPSVIGAEESFVVLTSSMSPAIKAGGLVVVNDVPTSEIDSGDVITFRRGGGANPVTHRVVEINRGAETTRFTTKGDANEQPDSEPVPAGDVVGKVWFSIPLVGYLIAFGNSRLGLVALVIVPAILLAASELWEMYRDSDVEIQVR